MAAPKRKPVTTARERNCAIQVQRARDDRDERDEGGYVLDSRDPGDRDGARGHGRQP
jgi:hypothetical protein